MHTLFHIYGPIAIHSYGLMIALGLLLFMNLTRRDSRYKALHLEPHFSILIMIGIGAAVIGGRLLFFLTYPDLYTGPASFFAFYEGGFAILGSVLAVLITIPFYLIYAKIPIIPLLDLVSIYAPLLQSIARIGCFFAGCCFGMPTTGPWGIIYTDTGSVAPLYVCLHPTQLYSAILLMLIFAFQYFVGRNIFQKPSQLVCSYLLLIATERFIIDFWRGDRVVDALQLSLDQYVALGIIGASVIGFVVSRLFHRS
jgi:phosphatidylglycerol---prolipoprotein diacylglyceryl transferase